MRSLSNTYFIVLILFLTLSFTIKAQVKIGDNHKTINPASLLELESNDKGLMFTRVALNDDLSIWSLKGAMPVDGMVVFNTNTVVNAEGLYCWYNNKWNRLGKDSYNEFDTLSFNVNTRMLYDDGDSVMIPTGYTAPVIRPGYILYTKYSSSKLVHDTTDFKLALADTFYQEPSQPSIINVLPPDVVKNDGYYAFAVPSRWSNPRISLKVRDSKNGDFFLLENCWSVTRDMTYNGVLYQIWTLDIPMRENVMHLDYQFKIE